MDAETRDAFLDLLAHMNAAASAYRVYASRGNNIRPRSMSDAFYSTRVVDFENAVERARVFLKGKTE